MATLTVLHAARVCSHLHHQNKTSCGVRVLMLRVFCVGGNVGSLFPFWGGEAVSAAGHSFDYWGVGGKYISVVHFCST